jgi:hypothetical protein
VNRVIADMLLLSFACEWVDYWPEFMLLVEFAINE